jgi:hypothetical protein
VRVRFPPSAPLKGRARGGGGAGRKQAARRRGLHGRRFHPRRRPDHQDKLAQSCRPATPKASQSLLSLAKGYLPDRLSAEDLYRPSEAIVPLKLHPTKGHHPGHADLRIFARLPIFRRVFRSARSPSGTRRALRRQSMIRARLFSMPPVTRPRARLRVFLTANTVPA